MRLVLVLAAALLSLVSACAQIGDALGAGAQQAEEFLPDGGPPVVNGFYEVGGACVRDSCPDVRADRAVELRDRPHPDGAVVGSTTRGEWVNWLSHHYRMRPIRGVVIRPHEEGDVRLQAGDVVYVVDTRSEYYTDDTSPTVWFRGETFFYELDEDEADYVRWESLWHSPSAA